MTASRHHLQRDVLTRTGFTLVELLLAAALTAVVMLAVYSSLSLYQRLITAGQDNSERTQLKRAILEAMKKDIQSLVYYAPPVVAAESGTASGDAAEADAGMEMETTDETGTEEIVPQAGSGLYGDLQTLMLHVSRPPLSAASQGDPALVTEVDLRSVSWFLATPNAAGLAGAVGNLASGGGMMMSRTSAVQGIARLQGPSFALDYADSQEATALLAERAEILTDEVTLLEFRYFDGLEWLDMWDSDAMESLPTAVEITIGFRAASTGTPSTTTSSTEESAIVDITRYVVELPLYSPPETESTETE